jgi:hypothetical protein
MPVRTRCLAGALLIVFGCASAAEAADQSDPVVLFNHDPTNKDIFTFDFSVPASPALQLVGLKQDAGSTVNSLKPFILSLPSLVDTGGSQQSAALDLSPAWILGLGGAQSTGSYFSSGTVVGGKGPQKAADPGGEWFRIAFRTHLSTAVYRGDEGGGKPSKAKDSRVAVGLSTSLLDSSDPLVARAINENESKWFKCLRDKKELIPPVATEEQDEASRLEAAFFGPNFPDQKPTRDLPTDKDFADAEKFLVQIGRLTATDQMQRATMTKDNRFTADRKDIDAVFVGEKQLKPDPAALQVISDCSQEASDIAQHNPALDLGLGVVWDGKPGKVSGLADAAFAFWASGRYPLQLPNTDMPCQGTMGKPRSELACWMLGGALRYSNGEFVATGNDTTPKFQANTLNTWLGIERVDKSSRLAISGGYTEDSARHSGDTAFSKSGFRWLASGSIALSQLSPLFDGVWLVGSYGTARGSVTSLDDKVFTLTLNFTAPKSASLFGSGG